VEGLVAFAGTQINAVSQLPGVLLIAMALCATVYAGPLVALAGTVTAILVVEVFGGLANGRHYTTAGLIIGVLVVVAGSFGVARVLARERESEERYRTLLEASFDAVVLSRDGRILEANEGFERLCGLEPGEAVGRSLYDFLPPETLDDVRAHIESGVSRPLETGWVTAQGERRFVRGVGQTVSFEGRPARLGALVDITEARRAETERAAADQRYRALFESAAVAVTLSSIDGVYVEANDVFCSLVKQPRERVVGRHFSEFAVLDAHGKPDVREEILAGAPGPFAFEATLVDSGGIQIPVRVSVAVVRDIAGEPLYTVTVLESIAEQRLLELQVRQTQKMEAIGQLAGGIAHDFNNLLTVIGGNVLLLEIAKLPDDAQEHIREISSAADRASALTKQLLTFSRAREPSPEAVDVNVIIGNVQGLLVRLIGDGVAIETILEGELPTVRADAMQLEQVLINLALNARDAMPDGGRLTILTERVGRSVVLRVGDTGIGMDEATRERVFEPFFTTKGPGEGTGLGLTNVYGIVTQADGEIAVASEPGVGTTFTISFPALAATLPTQTHRVPVEPAATGPTGRILFVDDEPAVRRIAHTALARAGHEPLLAASGLEALELLAAGQRVDLLVTDLSMPGMGGIELAERVRELHPELAVLYVSGFSDRHLEPQAAAEVLEKPFSPQTLAERVSGILAATNG
jgi:two-component system cell cycle sensor histidine kinase/response regulator CckA